MLTLVGLSQILDIPSWIASESLPNSKNYHIFYWSLICNTLHYDRHFDCSLYGMYGHQLRGLFMNAWEENKERKSHAKFDRDLVFSNPPSDHLQVLWIVSETRKVVRSDIRYLASDGWIEKYWQPCSWDKQQAGLRRGWWWRIWARRSIEPAVAVSTKLLPSGWLGSLGTVVASSRRPKDIRSCCPPHSRNYVIKSC